MTKETLIEIPEDAALLFTPNLARDIWRAQAAEAIMAQIDAEALANNKEEQA